MFQGDNHDALPHTVYDSRWHEQLMGWLASLTLEDEVRQNLSLPRVVCEYEDVFPDELPGLPPHRDVDFVIELHPGTSPISMTSHRMAPVELQELKVQIQDLLDRGFIRLSLSSVHDVFHVSMLWKYTPDPTHVVDWGELVVDTDGTFEEGLVRIMDSRDQVLRRKTVRLVKVLWRHRGVEEATWEREDSMHTAYPFLFEDEDTLFRHVIIE